MGMSKYFFVLFIFYLNGIFSNKILPQNITQKMVNTKWPIAGAKRMAKTTDPKKNGQSAVAFRKSDSFSKMPKNNAKKAQTINQSTNKNRDFDVFQGIHLTSLEHNFSLLDEKMEDSFLDRNEQFKNAPKENCTEKKLPTIGVDKLAKNNAQNLIEKKLRERELLNKEHGILLRIFKIKFKKLVHNNDQFVEELLTNECVMDIVEKYFSQIYAKAQSALGAVRLNFP